MSQQKNLQTDMTTIQENGDLIAYIRYEGNKVNLTTDPDELTSTMLPNILPPYALQSDEILDSVLNNGGHLYAINDTFTVNGGSVLATGRVLSVTGGGGIITTNLASGIDQGTGYAVNDTVTLNGGITLCTIRITGINGSGGVNSYIFLTIGSGYVISTHEGTTIVTGTGSGFALTVTSVTPATIVASYEITTPGIGYSVAVGINTTRTSGSGSGLIIDITAIGTILNNIKQTVGQQDGISYKEGDLVLAIRGNDNVNFDLNKNGNLTINAEDAKRYSIDDRGHLIYDYLVPIKDFPY